METTRLERAQRAQSAVALASLTPLAAGPTPHSPATRPRSLSFSHHASQFATSYNLRGFDSREDPFQVLVGAATAPLGTHARRHTKAPCRVEERDELWTRLGAKSIAFGGWNAGDGRVAEWSSRWGGAGAKRDLDESDAEDEDENDRLDILERRRADQHDINPDSGKDAPRTRRPSGAPARPLARTQSSLSVFHDSFEEEQDSVIASPRSALSYFPSPLSSPTMSRSNSRRHSASASPRASSLAALPPASPPLHPSALFAAEESQDGGTIDALAHSFLMTQQDAYGLFARVEAWLEWPWASPSASAAESSTRQSALPRVPSASSLGSATPPTPSLEHSTWSESGELSAYRRARSMAELNSKLEWERDEREGDERGLERDGLAAIVDVLAGLGGFL